MCSSQISYKKYPLTASNYLWEKNTNIPVLAVYMTYAPIFKDSVSEWKDKIEVKMYTPTQIE